MPHNMSPVNLLTRLNETRRRREQIFFRSRKGIVAIAIRTGVDIVPTYFLGQSQVRRWRARHEYSAPSQHWLPRPRYTDYGCSDEPHTEGAGSLPLT